MSHDPTAIGPPANATAARSDAFRLSLLFGAIYFIQGIGEPTEGLIAQPVRSLLNHWGQTTAQIGAFMALVSVPWAIKPLYGLISDFVPLAGSRRRSYLIVTTAATALSLGYLYFVPPQPGAIRLLLWLLVIPTVGVAFSDVVVDALMVERGQPLGLTGRLQSVQWAAMYSATVATGFVGGWLSENGRQEWGFLICAAATAVSFVLAVVWVREGPIETSAETAREAAAALGRAVRTPTVLVAAFKATLEEVLESDVILHVIDHGSEASEAQAEAVTRILAEAAAVMSMLSVARAAEVCDQPTLRRRSAILEQMEPGRAGQVLEGLSADQRTEIVRGMGEVSRRRLLPKLSAEVRAEVERLLQYPPHSAGGIMTTEFVRLDPLWTVGDCLKHVRGVAREKESIYAGYVMDREDGRLLGSVSLRDLVMAELDQPVEAIMRRKPVTVSVLDDQEAVAGKIAKYNLLAVPVLEKDGSVVGFVTVDDVVDVLIEEGTEDVLKMAAVEAGAFDRPYFETPVTSVIRLPSASAARRGSRSPPSRSSRPRSAGLPDRRRPSRRGRRGLHQVPAVGTSGARIPTRSPEDAIAGRSVVDHRVIVGVRRREIHHGARR